MKSKKKILFIILIISSLFLILIPKFVIGSLADIHYTFENDILYESNGISYTNEFNIRDITEFTNTYNGSYSFTDDITGSIPIGWTDESAGANEIIVSDSLDNHDKVLSLIDIELGNEASAKNIFSSLQASGTYEFYIHHTDVNKRTQIFLYDSGANLMVQFGIDLSGGNGKFQYVSAGAHDITDVSSNKWFHVRIDFETGAGGYLGLGADTYYFTLNGKRFGAYNFANVGGSAEYLLLRTGPEVLTTTYDAFYYSWDTNHNINDNMIPVIETNNLISSMDRYEFGLKTNNTLYSVGSDSASGWSDFDDGNDNVNVIADPNDINDRVIEIDTQQINDIKQWRKLDFTSTSEFVNITAGLNITTFTGVTSYLGIVLVTSDTINAPAGVYIFQNGDLQLETGTGYHTVRSDMSSAHFYDFNIFLNYELDIFIVRLSIDGIFDAEYIYTMVTPNKNGLSKIYFYNKWIDDKNTAYVDYCGVYESGLSIAENEYGWASVAFGGSDWDFRYHNLYTSQASGIIHSSSVQGSYTVGMTTNIINDFQQFNNISTFINVYDNYQSLVVNPTFIYTFNGTNFNIYNITIEGVRLREGSNEYNLTYSHSGILTNESYFYVDTNNRLQFSLITNDTDTEYIQATFDIPNVDSTDRAISFRGYRLNKAYGYFYVDYIVGASRIDIPLIEKTTRAILPINKTIDNFIVLITDNDIDTILGTTNGYVSRPILLNVLGIGLPIVTAGLIEMMIPLLLIMIPTLLISRGFGKEGKKLLIPLFLVFSLIATATLIIPVWIFFIIAFGTGLFLFRNKEIEGEY